MFRSVYTLTLTHDVTVDHVRHIGDIIQRVDVGCIAAIAKTPPRYSATLSTQAPPYACQ